MIQGNYDKTDLLQKKEELSNYIPNEYKKYISENNKCVTLKYPLNNQPEKIKSINLDKTPQVRGTLTGIKGQYLILDNENVINVRKYTGYIISINLK